MTLTTNRSTRLRLIRTARVVKINPGWDMNAASLDAFTDVREIQQTLKARGMKFETEADETTTGPGYFIVVDPDGNPILVDQHV